MARRVAKPVIVNGVRYRSTFEARVAKAFHELHQNWGVAVSYEKHPLIYTVDRVYVPDFVVELPTRKVYIESKGYFDANDRQKLREVREQNPDLDLRLLFQSPSMRLTRRPASLTYGQWATRHGFRWAKGPSIPQEWIDEWIAEAREAQAQ